MKKLIQKKHIFLLLPYRLASKKAMLLTITAVVAMFITFSCSKTKTTQPAANGTTVSISGMAFPASTSIKMGDTITWVNNDGVPHTVTSDDGVSFSSNTISAQSSFSFKATSVGSFPYHCNVHANMHGTLVVTQ